MNILPQTSWIKKKGALKKHNQNIKPYESTIDFCKFLKKNKIILPETKKVIDLGCGTGTYLNYFSKNFKKTKFYGLDYSKTLIQIAKKMKLKNVDFYVSNILKKNTNKKFLNSEALICIQTFCVFREPEKIIKFIVSLKPNKVAINSLFYDGPLDVFIHIKDYDDLGSDKGSDGDFNTFSIQKISEIFKKYGYILKKKKEYFPKKKILNRKNNERGSYTIKDKKNKNLVFSGPVYLPWHFLYFEKNFKNKQF